MTLSAGRLGLAVCIAGLLIGCERPDAGRAAPVTDAGVEPRVVTLAPHLAELAFAAGAGSNVVAVSAYSNYPDDVLTLPNVGDAFAVDLEGLALLSPDIILAWQSGTPSNTVAELRARGYRVETMQTESLQDIATTLRRIGRLTGHAAAADAAADRFLSDLDVLHRNVPDDSRLRVFYQISAQPLYTVNGSHYVSELIDLCGGENVFADLGDLAPTVTEEAVLVRDPEVLLAGRIDPEDRPFSVWGRWPELAANRYDNRFYVHADLLGRAGPRLVRAGAAVCQWLDEGRRNRDRFDAAR